MSGRGAYYRAKYGGKTMLTGRAGLQLWGRSADAEEELPCFDAAAAAAATAAACAGRGRGGRHNVSGDGGPPGHAYGQRQFQEEDEEPAGVRVRNSSLSFFSFFINSSGVLLLRT
ncbi:hypothetical protein ENH_00057350 [Eimeria necatrix]|uniref:Uncharacterized protein n=1 Tax=Eimeria necatrix TaxID=51315 RepID=U6N0A5_9EIME|nr:hypothetical protein ENH_00057350 [Eimeria necatrix]CDJ68733.1 hypothetical protein ENH_00057350 [Eimeria necatrix]